MDKLGSSEDSLIDLKQPHRLEVLLLDQDSSLVLCGKVFPFCWAPHLILPFLTSSNFISHSSFPRLCPALPCSLSKVFPLYPLLLFPLLVACMALFFSPSSSLIPSLSSVSPAAVSTRKDFFTFFFSHWPVDLLLFLVGALWTSSMFSHATCCVLEGSCDRVRIWTAIWKS